MIVLKMTPQGAGVLKGILAEALDETQGEIVRTENWERKDVLKEERRLLEDLAAQLEKALKSPQAA